MSLLFSHRKESALPTVRLDSLSDAKSALEKKGLEPKMVRIKVCNDAIFREIHGNDDMLISKGFFKFIHRIYYGLLQWQ